MGKLKKALGKVTKPLAKVLDKLIPNEIKPALPYMAAFAPLMMGPTGMMGSSMWRRALMSGALNLGSQLAQEGSEGEFSGLSALLAAGTGALTSPDAPGFFEGMQQGKAIGVDKFDNLIYQKPEGIMGAIQSGIGTGGEAAAKFLSQDPYSGGAGDVLRPGGTKVGLNLNTLQAAGVPVSHATGDLAMADARRALRDYEDQMAADESMSLIDDDGRRRAIRAAMESAGHLEEVIVETLGVLGLKDGGRVSFQSGGKYDSRATPGEFRKALENVSAGSVAQQEKDLQQFTQSFLHQNKLRQGDIGGLGGLHLQDRGGYTLTGGPDAKPNFANIYAGYLGKGLNKDQIRGQAIADTFSLSGPYSDPMLTPGTASPYSWESMVQNKAQADYIAQLLGAKDGGRISKEGGGVASVLPKGREADYRGGGVIPVGSRERADDVPARLSKNEFVMTADAVRAAGGGSINKGAKRMYNLMHNLEARV